MSGLIYFPFIQLPNNDWLYRSLLYWDRVATIIPGDYLQHLEETYPDGFLQKLFDRGLAEHIDPVDVIYNQDSFDQSFLDYVDNDAYPVKGDSLPANYRTFRIHTGKMFGISQGLAERDLARPMSDPYNPWVEVESFTAGRFMAYLAGVIGGLTGLTPATDRRDLLATFANELSTSGEYLSALDTNKAIVLEGVLPVPVPEHDIDDQYLDALEAFKREHGAELVEYREKIEAILLYLQELEDEDIRNSESERLRQDLQVDIARISHLIENSDMSLSIRGSILTITAATLAFGVAALTTPVAPGILLLGAVATALGVANQLTSGRQADQQTASLARANARIDELTEQVRDTSRQIGELKDLVVYQNEFRQAQIAS